MTVQINNIAIPLQILLPIIIFILIAVFLLLFLFLKKTHGKSAIKSAFSLKLLKIKVPKIKSINEEKNIEETQDKIKEEISVAENLYSILGGLKAQRGLKGFLKQRTDHFSLEIVVQNSLIYFYIGVPENQLDFFKERIQAVYPEAQIEPIDDYNIFTPQSHVAGAYLIFDKGFIFPLKTYKKIELDPLDSLTNSLTKIADKDGAVIQITTRSAHKKWHHKSSLFSRTVSKGKSIEYAKYLIPFSLILF